MQRYPAVRVEMRVLNRPVDPVEEGVDLALRVRPEIEDSATLVAKTFGISRGILVASPDLLQRQGPVRDAGRPVEARHGGDVRRGDGRTSWRLEGPDGEVHVHHAHAALRGRRPADAQVRGGAGHGRIACCPTTCAAAS